MLQEHDKYTDETERLVRSTSASVISSSLFSSATPLCVFDDDSVTIGGKPSIAILKNECQHRPAASQAAKALCSSSRAQDARFVPDNMSGGDTWGVNLAEMTEEEASFVWPTTLVPIVKRQTYCLAEF